MVRRLILCVLSLAAATAVWLPCAHFLFRPDVSEFLDSDGISPNARRLSRRHVRLWTEADLREAALAEIRTANAEWDFMGRSFFVWSLANMAMRDEQFTPTALEVMDAIIDETLRLERDEGMYFFLMPYAKRRHWVLSPARSQFIDGEIALMLAMRRLVEEKPQYMPLLAERVRIMIERMEKSPVLSAESYPDECWTFCNVIALSAIRVHDHLDGADHSKFIRRWLTTAKSKLIDRRTGLLVSSYTLGGEHLDGPEGSSIWMVAHCLSLLDEEFARDQYKRANEHLSRSILGFGYAREWPESWTGPMDIDSGAVVPGLGLSVSASGMAFIAAATFDDRQFYRSLATSLEFAGMPIEDDAGLRYATSNQVGDAVLLYSMSLGPAWRKVREGEKP